MRSVLRSWPLALMGSAIACAGSPPNASQSPIVKASQHDLEAQDTAHSKKATMPSEASGDPQTPAALSALVGVSSPFKATFRVDTTIGGLDGTHAKKVLLSSAKKLENCAYASDFTSHWTVGLSLQVDLSGNVKLVAEGAMAPLVRCLDSVVMAMKFPSATEATQIDAAIMIQYSKLAEKTTSPRDQFGMKGVEGGVQGGVVGGVIGGVLGGHGQGGYGYGLSGIGGGGTGYGTIGSGGYGAIGHGSKGPIVRAGSPITKGTLSRDIIRRVIRRHIPRIRFCYEKQLVNQPRLQGRITARFTIAATGRVSRASASGMRRSVGFCVEQAIKRMHFPRPTGGVVQVTYPFTFSPGSP